MEVLVRFSFHTQCEKESWSRSFSSEESDCFYFVYQQDSLMRFVSSVAMGAAEISKSINAEIKKAERRNE